MNRTFTASAPLDVLARSLMDEDFILCPRDDVTHEYARLGKPNRDDPAQIIIIYRCGCVRADGDAWTRASVLLTRMVRGGTV